MGLLEWERGLLEYTVVASGAGSGDVVVGYDTGSFEYKRGLLECNRGLLAYTVVAGGTGGGDVVVPKQSV